MRLVWGTIAAALIVAGGALGAALYPATTVVQRHVVCFEQGEEDCRLMVGPVTCHHVDGRILIILGSIVMAAFVLWLTNPKWHAHPITHAWVPSNPRRHVEEGGDRRV